jgi:hypothetical protein
VLNVIASLVADLLGGGASGPLTEGAPAYARINSLFDIR